MRPSRESDVGVKPTPGNFNRCQTISPIQGTGHRSWGYSAHINHRRVSLMHSIIYLIGLIVVVMFVLGSLGLR
jgi:hypothetical protein